jgi:hypothetical protein
MALHLHTQITATQYLAVNRSTQKDLLHLGQRVRRDVGG